MADTVQALLNSLVALVLIMVFVWSLWYFFIFQNFMEVALEVWGWDFFPVEQQLWWMIVGLILLSSFAGAIKIYQYSRRGEKAY